MSPSRLFLTACAVAGLLGPTAASAQEEERSDGVRVERDGDEIRIYVDEDDDGEPERRFTIHIGDDGPGGVRHLRHVPGDSLEVRIGPDGLRFGPDGAFRIGPDGFGLDLPGMAPFEGLPRRGHGAFSLGDGGPFEPGLSPETRRELLELERQAGDLARQARRAEGGDRRRLEGELDALLGRLFEARGRARTERAEQMERRADELRREAETLREGARERDRERRALIEQRKRELLGDDASDW